MMGKKIRSECEFVMDGFLVLDVKLVNNFCWLFIHSWPSPSIRNLWTADGSGKEGRSGQREVEDERSTGEDGKGKNEANEESLYQ